MLGKALVRGVKQSKHIQIYEHEGIHSTSGIRATIFGATGFIGKELGNTLGSIGSDIVYPSKNIWTISDDVKRLRLTGNLGMVYINHNTNFEDPRAIFRTVEHSNVVINCIGPRKYSNTYKQFQNANLDVARLIAKQARLAGVKRFIHLSSVGADPKSPSLDLQTKFYGEQAVLGEFPDATIFRLCTVVGMNDYFQKIFRKQASFFTYYVPVYSDLKARRQPITDTDVGLCVLNALKMPETCGRVYEIGGPHVYTLHEIYEVMMNILQKPLTFAKLNRGLAIKAASIKSWQYFSYDDILKSELDLRAERRPGVGTIEDLLVKPASVVPTLEELLSLYKELVGTVKDDAHI